ncbi:MAG TPA: hypothetical protein VE326_11580 [Candidatus Binatia bacterium]|nr:hypothetical protein [Candidatus Binatia bacterium]
MLPAELAALAAQRRYVTQVTATNTWRLVDGLWRRVNRNDPAGSWDRTVAPTIGKLMRAAQYAAASGAQQYVTAALDVQGVDPDSDGTVSPTAFVGTASDGNDLDGLLRVPAVGAQNAIDQGAAADVALAEAGTRLKRIVDTQISDAARVPVGVAINAARHAEGYIRMLTPPSCARCVILAGKWYKSNAGFKRHPNCDCIHVPASEDYGRHYTTDPHAYFDSLIEDEQNRVFTKAGATAIREHGADIFQVVNARRQMRWVQMAGRQLRATQIGVTKRSLAGQRLGAGKKRKVIRLTPESIYQIAGDNRTELLRLLRLHGYIT